MLVGYLVGVIRNVGMVVVLVAGLLASCGIGGRQSFREAFPDPLVLVTTKDPARVRARLADTVLPDDVAHNEQLLAMLRSRETMDASHLALLVRAVALPENFVFSTGAGRWAYPDRGEGAHAAFVDQLLMEGAEKLQNVDGYWLGELIGISQSSDTMQLLCERFVPSVDDGSDLALDELLRGMPGSPAMLPFLAEYMEPQGRLEGDRGWRAFGKMSFDSDRTALLGILMRGDGGVTGDRLLLAMKAFSFDDGRMQALQMLVDKAAEVDSETARAAVATFSFDSGREGAFATFAKRGGTVLDEQQLVKFVRLCSFDSGKIKCVKLFVPSLRGEPSGDAAKQLLGKFSFDSDRLRALELLASRWRELPESERGALLKVFAFESSRTEARALLGL